MPGWCANALLTKQVRPVPDCRPTCSRLSFVLNAGLLQLQLNFESRGQNGKWRQTPHCHFASDWPLFSLSHRTLNASPSSPGTYEEKHLRRLPRDQQSWTFPLLGPDSGWDFMGVSPLSPSPSEFAVIWASQQASIHPPPQKIKRAVCPSLSFPGQFDVFLSLPSVSSSSSSLSLPVSLCKHSPRLLLNLQSEHGMSLCISSEITLCLPSIYAFHSLHLQLRTACPSIVCFQTFVWAFHTPADQAKS